MIGVILTICARYLAVFIYVKVQLSCTNLFFWYIEWLLGTFNLVHMVQVARVPETQELWKDPFHKGQNEKHVLNHFLFLRCWCRHICKWNYDNTHLDTGCIVRNVSTAQHNTKKGTNWYCIEILDPQIDLNLYSQFKK